MVDRTPMIWKHLGFNKNIYFVEPLEPSDSIVKLFVGRDDEIKQFLIDSFGSTRALKIVTGDIGIGKTTFVNACQYYSYSQNSNFDLPYEIPRCLPSYRRIQILSEYGTEAIVQTALETIATNANIELTKSGKNISKEFRELIEIYTSPSVNIGGGGLSIGAAVIQGGISSNQKDINASKNKKYYIEKLVNMITNELDLDGIFLTIDNIDIYDKDKFKIVINELRDILFDIDGIFWTIIGQKGITSSIQETVPRVADFLSGTETQLVPLKFDDLKALINRRVEFFLTSNDARAPISEFTLQAIHILCQLDTRETLHFCSEITNIVLSRGSKSKVIPRETAENAILEYANKLSLETDLSDKQLEVLKEMYISNTIRPKDYEKYGYDTSQGFISTIRSLKGKKLLTVAIKQKNKTVYRITGKTLLIALTGRFGLEISSQAKEEFNNIIEKLSYKENLIEIDGQLNMLLEF